MGNNQNIEVSLPINYDTDQKNNNLSTDKILQTILHTENPMINQNLIYEQNKMSLGKRNLDQHNYMQLPLNKELKTGNGEISH